MFLTKATTLVLLLHAHICLRAGAQSMSGDTCRDSQRSVQTVGHGLMSCYDMGRLSPDSCYRLDTLAACCQTCANIRNSVNQPRCPYGDGDIAYCKAIETKKHDCYDPRIAITCCGSCTRWKSRRVGCEYGDRAEWCRNVGGYDCYGSEVGKDCCESCSRFYDSRYRGCEFGDRAPWCGRLPQQENCPREDVADLCCRSCAAIKKSRFVDQDCRDQASWCSTLSARDCYVYATATTCCFSCSRYTRSK